MTGINILEEFQNNEKPAQDEEKKEDLVIEEEQQKVKPSECINSHPLTLMHNAKPREVEDGDFKMGEDISCSQCSAKINIEQGYYSCQDVCDFDVHQTCCALDDQLQENTFEHPDVSIPCPDVDMKCPWDHDLEKREPGFTKRVKALRDEEA